MESQETWESEETGERCLHIEPSTVRSKTDSAPKAACDSYAKMTDLATGHRSRQLKLTQKIYRQNNKVQGL